MQTVDLCDEIEVCEDVGMRFICSDPSLEDDDNLVLRAARLLGEAARSKSGCRLMLQKAIPHAAGLGGGSSDAATTLRALNDYWSLNLSRATLADFASRLGSDVPFFLRGGTAVVTGRGEFVTPLPETRSMWYALVKPPISVPTSAVFNLVSPRDWSDGASTRAVARAICDRGALSLGINGLQRALFELYPVAQECFEDVARAAPGRTFVSGSGPTVGALCVSRVEAEQVVASVTREGRWTAVVQSISRRDG
jgi:4-diphosphocytidyl-2-C-methyl-D-erythritol kinase